MPTGEFFSMSGNPQVILSGFGDEAALHKTAVEQFSAFAALGLQYYSLRFVDVGRGVKNVMKLSTAEIQKIRHLEDEYDLSVASIGSPIGKVKLLDATTARRTPSCRSPSIWPRKSAGLRVGPCVRDQIDSRIFVLSAARSRSVAEHLRRPSIRSARSPKRAIVRI